MAILVQSFLNSATKLSTTATTATTVAQLKTLVNAIEGVSTSTMQFYIVNPSTTSTALVSGTLGSYGITTATTIYSSNTISTLAIASGSTITEDFSPAQTNTEIVDPYSDIWGLNYSPLGLGVTNDTSYKLYVTSLGISSAITLTSHYGDNSVTAGNFLYDTYGASLGIIKGNATIDNYMAKAAAVCGALSSTIITAATYRGTWNAFSNTPTLIDGVGTLGDAYSVTTSGTSGAFPAYGEQDWRIYDGSVWQRVAKTTTTQWTIAPAAGGLADKATRQLAKLELAQLRRQAGGDTSSTFYRSRNIYDVDLLADKYTSPTSTVGTTSTLVIGRPWVSIPAPVTQDLILFFDSERTDCYPGTGTTIYNLVDNTPSTLFGDVTYSDGVLRISNTDTPIAGNRISGIQCQTVTGFKTISLWYKQITDSAGYYSYIVDARTGMPGGWIYDTPSNDYFGESWAAGTMFIDGGPSQSPTYTQQLNVWRNVTFVTDGTAFTDNITLFSRYTQTEGLDVEFGACMIYSRAITEAENKQNYDQFKTRYGL